jgi:hypothetical protein
MKNIKAISGILLIFLLGAASGAIITHMVHRARHEAFLKGGPAAREEVIIRRLTKRLDLDSQQQEQVKTVIHENHIAMQEFRKQTHPQIEALLEQGQKRINTILRPEQQEKFQKIIAERKKRRKYDLQ